ncbi:MAG: DUF5722 domain-containing protein [Cyclobacteriaceae bacterium]
MKRSILVFCLFPAVILGQNLQQSLMLDTQKAIELEVNKLPEDVYDITTSGQSPHVFTFPLKSPLGKNITTFSFDYFCPTGLDFVKLHFYPEVEGRAPKIVRDVGSTEGWVEFRIDIADKLQSWGKTGDYLRIDLGGAPGLNIQIRNIKVRQLTEREQEIQKQQAELKAREKILEANLVSYLSSDFGSQVLNVHVENDQLFVRGKVVDEAEVYLAEISPYEHVTEKTAFEYIKPIELSSKKTFEVSIDRFIKRYGFTQDRVLSKWAIVKKVGQQYQLTSHARYADTITPKYRYPFVKPTNKKGLGGYSAHRDAPQSDLDDLGITSATVNIWVNQFFRSGPSKENMPFEYLGKIYYINKASIEKYDATLRSTAKRNIEVSAILLVAKADKSPDKEIGRILQHPDCDPAGIYSMPNVTTPEGVQYYAAVLDFLASRYMRADKKYGRIHHWIIHNEVDAGWVWTNAGDKTALVFMDLYVKSMRMSHNIARKYNPNSKVFITLTHYWNWTSNPHFYHSKELLELLLQFSKKEGDFDWAIAHHPYPESLREPKTWLDKKVSFDFNTQLITFKNLEVLDAWVKQPEVLYKGKTKRIVYLSENGTNSRTYSQEHLHEQAAGMAYAWKKMEHLDGIDGFQYHNWQDNRREGGLRIGLRRFPDDEENPGGIKPVWEVYQAASTENEDRVFEQYKELIGIDDWDEIRHRETIYKAVKTDTRHQ